MSKSPLVSVIIPTYNEERYIGKCLSSIFSQTYKSFEVIVIDDGSTDKTIEIVKKFNAQLVKQKHKGPSPARNLGAKKAKGKILMFLDADIRYDKNYIKYLMKPIIDNKAIGTFNKTELVANTDNIWSNCWAINSDLTIKQRNRGDLSDELPLFRAILKSEFDKVGGYDDVGYGQDSTISIKLGKKAKGVENAIAYHYNPETLSEVFFSARFIGRGRYFFKPNFYNLLRFSLLNSFRISLKKILKGAPFEFLIFKLIYDIGMFVGIFFSTNKKSK